VASVVLIVAVLLYLEGRGRLTPYGLCSAALYRE
jgi:hypothetical protein